MSLIFIAFGKTPSVIKQNIHIRHCLKADDVQIVFYNDFKIHRHIFLDLTTDKKYPTLNAWGFPQEILNKIEEKYGIRLQYILDGLWDAGNHKTIAKSIFIRHEDGIIHKNNTNCFFIWVVCSWEREIKFCQNLLMDKYEDMKTYDNGHFVEEEYVLIAKPGIDKLAKYLLLKNGKNKMINSKGVIILFLYRKTGIFPCQTSALYCPPSSAS